MLLEKTRPNIHTCTNRLFSEIRITDSDQNSTSKPTYLSIHDNLTSEQMVTENNTTVFSIREA